LAKCGYYSSNPELILKARVDIIIDLLVYENFLDDFQNAYIELNKEIKG
jgi:hypothetical protein